jgi:enoyl-CoA hydratase/carnithine racemase
MNSQRIVVEQENEIAIFHLSAPPANCLDAQTVRELGNLFERYHGNSGSKAIILTGSGDVFSVGAELRELAQTRSAGEAEEIVCKAKRLFDLVEGYNKPVLAAVNGLCLGGGLELALACHMRIASENSRFGFPEINLGLMPGAGGTQRLPRLIGIPRSFEIILTGELFSAREALEIGMINRITPIGNALEATKQIALKIAAKDRMAVAAAMEAIRFSLNKGPEAGMDSETRLFGQLSQSENAREGISAFLEKRKRKFKDT